MELAMRGVVNMDFVELRHCIKAEELIVRHVLIFLVLLVTEMVKNAGSLEIVGVTVVKYAIIVDCIMVKLKSAVKEAGP
jgi:hypothetical protein